MRTKGAQLDGAVPPVKLAQPFNNEELEKRIVSILRSHRLVSGEMVLAFEQALGSYVGCKNVVCLNSGTAAIHSALLALKLERGEKNQVITTPLSFAATANAIIHAGCRPVFVDVDPETFNIDPNQIRSSINQRTLAVEPVDVYGLPAELDEIKRVTDKQRIPIVEDAAESIGARKNGKMVGNISTLTCFSTYATKNLHTGEGGFITTNNSSLASSIRKIRNQGQSSRYNQTTIGYNFRMLEFCAAIGLAQIPILDELNKKRRENALFLKEKLSKFDSLGFQKVSNPEEHSWYLFSLTLNEKKARMKRDLFVERVKQRGVEADVAWPLPIHLQPYFIETFGHKKGEFPNAERISREVFQLPVHPFLTHQQLEQIIAVVTDVLGQ